LCIVLPISRHQTAACDGSDDRSWSAAVERIHERLGQCGYAKGVGGIPTPAAVPSSARKL